MKVSINLLLQITGVIDLVLQPKLESNRSFVWPIIATVELGTALAGEISGAGIVTRPGDAAALAQAICQLVDDPAIRAAMDHHGQERAQARWSPKAILADFEEQLWDLMALGGPRKGGAAMTSEAK